MQPLSRPIIFDVTRLITRLGRSVPNGIDRVDIAYAQHFLDTPQGSYGALFGCTGVPRLVAGRTSRAIADAIAAGWREDVAPDDDVAYSLLRGRLEGGISEPRPVGGRDARVLESIRRFKAKGKILGGGGLWPGEDVVQQAPRNSIYLNVSQFPIWNPRYTSWLGRRPDVKAIFFLHDLLPIQYPEFFRAFETKRHEGRLDTIARRAAGVIVASEETKAALIGYLRSRGASLPPMLVAPLPLAPNFRKPARRTGDTRRTGTPPYFLCVGTIEPRKNHLMLLQVWRELSRRMGRNTPLLVVVGASGWDHENVLDLIERCPWLQETVTTTSQLSTPGLIRLMADATAVLMPTFAEGYGLPAAEAVATGVPVIASDIPVFRAHGSPLITLVDPLDGLGWMAAIERHLDQEKQRVRGVVREAAADSVSSAMLHFEHVEDFLTSIA